MSNSFFDRLKRLHDAHHRGRDTTDGPSGVYTADMAEESGDEEVSKPPPRYGGWEGLGASSQLDYDAPLWVLETRSGVDTIHGDWTVGQCRDVDHKKLADRVEGIAGDTRRQNLLYMDLETTGLGPKALIFMAGIGFWQGSEFVVQHLVIDEGDDEVALLQAFAEILADYDVLVTFNGKRFDVPLLQKRYEHHDLPDPFGDEFHLDLLPVARRLFPGLNRYKLTSLEEQLLDFQRVDDVPGREIPPLWWKFQKTRNPALMARVVEHNRYDIISMAALVATAINGECPGDEDEQGDAKQSYQHRFSNLISRSDRPPEEPHKPAGEMKSPDGIKGKLMRSYKLRGKFAERDKERVASQKAPTFSTGEEVSRRVDELYRASKTLVEQQLWREAFPMLCEILALDPEHGWGLETLAQYYRREGREELARELEARKDS